MKTNRILSTIKSLYRRTKIKLLLLFVLSNLQLNNVCAQVNITSNKQTTDFLDSFRVRYVNGMLSKDLKTVLDSYAENVRLMPEFQKTILGKQNAKLYHEAFLNRHNIQKYNRTKIEILNLDSFVVELGYLNITFANKESRQTFELKGKYQNIWQRKNGTLLLMTEAWNYNHQVGFAEELKFKEVPSTHMALEKHLPIRDNISFELAGLNALMENTIKQKDPKIWARFYADDGMFIYSFNPIYQGRKALDQYLEKHVVEIPIFEKLDIRNDQIDDLKNGYVIEYATHVANWRSGEYSGVSTGKNIRIWRREANGTLKIYRQMAMYD